MLSLVTACMNREHHLRRSLAHWLTLPGIDEIVIVDWSNQNSLVDLTALDPRIRVIRVEDEPRWVLPYAYNLGIERARGDVILKCDADCLPTAAVSQLRPASGRFYSGDWRSGDKVGKSCVNGQCLFTKEQWRAIGGYSELLRRYGHDDVDFYNRLVSAGHERREIAPELLDFLDHTNADRVAHNPSAATPDSVEALLHSQLGYHEAINVVITSFQPWGAWYPISPYKTVSTGERHEIVLRDLAREIPISETLQHFARSNAVRTITARLCKIPPAVIGRMDNQACLTQLARLVVPAKT